MERYTAQELRLIAADPAVAESTRSAALGEIEGRQAQEETRNASDIAMNPPYVPPEATGGEGEIDTDAARPDAIRKAINKLFNVPINEGRFKGSRDKLGIFKVKPRAIRVRNQSDVGTIAHRRAITSASRAKPCG